MSNARVIKKYPNRRLYDTAESRYITLADVQQLVLQETPFSVVDKNSGTDITWSILMQVISDQQHQAAAVLSKDLLLQIIRTMDAGTPGAVAEYLERSLHAAVSQQQKSGARSTTSRDADTGAAVAEKSDNTGWKPAASMGPKAS